MTRFPSEAVPLVLGAAAFTAFAPPHEVSGWVSLVVMASLGWRWINIWFEERRAPARCSACRRVLEAQKGSSRS